MEKGRNTKLTRQRSEHTQTHTGQGGFIFPDVWVFSGDPLFKRILKNTKFCPSSAGAADDHLQEAPSLRLKIAKMFTARYLERKLLTLPKSILQIFFPLPSICFSSLEKCKVVYFRCRSLRKLSPFLLFVSS